MVFAWPEPQFGRRGVIIAGVRGGMEALACATTTTEKRRDRIGIWTRAARISQGTYVWSHDIGRALRAAHAIEAGWVQVNQGLGQSPGHSYGGYKESGIGREFSLEGMLDSYTQRKNVTVNLTH